MGQVAVLLAVCLAGLVLAVEEGRDRAAIVCLLVLSLKPHLLLVPLAVLAAQRRWGLLARFALAAGAVAAVTMAVLGPTIYLDYLAAVPRLEPYWGKGGPHFMINLRGALLRLLGAGAPAVGPLTYAGLVGATVAAYVLSRRQAARGAPASEAWPLALALGLLFNPHLFLHDAVLWAVPLALFHGQLRRRGRDTVWFTIFVLTWPALGMVNDLVEQVGILLPVHLLFAEALVATAWLLARTHAAAKSTRPATA
jgi:hypothetical protein